MPAHIKTCHIPTLPNAETCRSLLQRIYQEFHPILEKRGYNVVSLSEMCCCGDGMDHDKTRRRRKLRIMSAQVGGYNMTRGGGRGGKSHSIHLRLRNPHDHSSILSYEQVAGVMAHELAHCGHGNHSAAFYKLMDEILDQHAVFMAKGIVADQQGFPMDSRQAYTLGGGKVGTNAKSAALQAAQRRQAQQQWMPSGPQKLGGGSCQNKRGVVLPPGLAAAQAAQERRLRDEVWCQPCANDVIELSSDSENDDEEEDCKPAANQDNTATASTKEEEEDSKPAAVSETPGAGTDGGSDKENAMAGPEMATQKDSGENQVSQTRDSATDSAARSASDVVTIDLTTSDDEQDTITNTTSRGRRPKKRRHQDTSSTTTFTAEWSCSRCTFRNVAGSLVCGMCGKESNVAEERSKQAVAEICKTDAVEKVKEAEVQDSLTTFGFNIYGSDKQASAKLPHIT